MELILIQKEILMEIVLRLQVQRKNLLDRLFVMVMVRLLRAVPMGEIDIAPIGS